MLAANCPRVPVVYLTSVNASFLAVVALERGIWRQSPGLDNPTRMRRVFHRYGLFRAGRPDGALKLLKLLHLVLRLRGLALPTIEAGKSKMRLRRERTVFFEV
jgi:hypothetical protein